MPGLADIFTPDAFGIVTMTAAIQKLPAAPNTLAPVAEGGLGVFREIPIATTHPAIEENQGVLALIPTTHRGGPGTAMKPEKRKAFDMHTAHIQADDTIQADDVLNVRAFGTQDQEQAVQDVVNGKLLVMRRSIDTTNEYLRLGAVMGLITYPTGSVDANVDPYTLLGLTDRATDQTVVAEFCDAAKDPVAEKIPEARDGMETALGGTPYTGRLYALCGRTFFRALIGHTDVKEIYDHQQAMYAAQQAVDMARPNRMRVTIGGITFEEYYGVVSGQTFIPAAEAFCFPLGADLLHTYWSPGDTWGLAGTLGQPMYARQYLSPDGKSVVLEAQSNPLHIPVRPVGCLRFTLA